VKQNTVVYFIFFVSLCEILYMNKRKIIWTIVTIIVLSLSIFIYWRFYFVFAEGTKAGQLNTFQRKGYLFKTYEGILIQSGFKANVQSNEFEFSVKNEAIAKTLLENAGKEMELHYQRYLGVLPWRGNNLYVVDSIYQIRGASGESVIKPK
jgi:hypothetical protein